MKESDITLYKRIIRASNREYNIGLEKARVRDLSGAILYLNRALRLNKNHTDARNLLGLIYYEMGEFVEALSQWVISKNLNPADNLADEYLEEIQADQRRLEAVNQNIKKYNQALAYANKGSEDLAIMQLRKVLAANPRFVKGYQLLALLYLHKNEYEKAKKALYQTLRIDKNNTLALKYMAEVKSLIKTNSRLSKKEKNDQKEEIMRDEVIIPTYREDSGWRAILQIAFGLILGAALTMFLFLPAKTKAFNNENRELVLGYNEKLDVKDNDIADLEKKISELEDEKLNVESNLSAYTDENTGMIAEYNELLKTLSCYIAGDMAETARVFLTIDIEKISDETFLNTYAVMKTAVEEKGWQALYDKATAAFSSGDFEMAKEYYLASLSINPDYKDAMYWLGYTYENLGDKETADTYYTQVIENAPNSNVGQAAKSRRGY